MSTPDCCDKLPDFTVQSIVNNFCIPPTTTGTTTTGEPTTTSTTTAGPTTTGTTTTGTTTTGTTTTGTTTTCEFYPPNICDYDGNAGSAENVYVSREIIILDTNACPPISGYNPANYPAYFIDLLTGGCDINQNEEIIFSIYYDNCISNQCYDSSKVVFNYDYISCDDAKGCVWESVAGDHPPYWQLISNNCDCLTGDNINCNDFTFGANCGDCTGWDLYSPPNENGFKVSTSCLNTPP
jgi:hypothetical protein